MTLPFLARRLKSALAGRGRGELGEAVGRVGLTDDGKSVYVHLQSAPGWTRRQPGEAYLLCHADYPDLTGLASFRWLVAESKLEIDQEIDRIIRWLARE